MAISEQRLLLELYSRGIVKAYLLAASLPYPPICTRRPPIEPHGGDHLCRPNLCAQPATEPTLDATGVVVRSRTPRPRTGMRRSPPAFRETPLAATSSHHMKSTAIQVEAMPSANARCGKPIQSLCNARI